MRKWPDQVLLRFGVGCLSHASGETVQLNERLSDYVMTLEGDTFLVGGTWGSPIVPHDLTIRLHPDFIPLRLQREPIGNGASTATVIFNPEGAVVSPPFDPALVGARRALVPSHPWRYRHVCGP